MLQEVYSSEDENNEDYTTQGQLKQHHQSLGSVVRNTITNLTYNLRHNSLIYLPLIQRKQVILKSDGSKAYLLGGSYDYTSANRFLQRFQKTIWISYRSGIQRINGDAGWGCMIRVVQMVFAEIFQRHLLKSTNEVVNLFKEGINAPFSLLNICKIGNINHRWTGCCEILSLIQYLIGANPQYNNLQVTIYTSGIRIPNIEQVENSKQKWKPKTIIITQTFKSQNLPEQYLPHLKHIMRHQSFCGMIGGISGEALYILGYYEDQAIILDPHYVQKVQTQADSTVSYFKKTPRSVSFNKLCSTMALCFYFKKEIQYKQWISWIIHAQQIYQQDTVFSVQVENPQSWLKKFRKVSEDDFIDLGDEQ